MSKAYYWWNVYGRFEPGEGNLPHLGQVIRYYRKLRGMEKAELASALGCTKRFVEMIESDHNTTMPDKLSRRIMLAKALHIPPILLGLSSVTLFEWGEGSMVPGEAVGTEMVASTQTMLSSEHLLALSWELYYTSTVQKAADSIDTNFALLNREFEHATGVKRDQYDAMRCRFYQLYSLVFRDRLEIEKALAYENQAVVIAFRLKNAELIASALLRRARIFIHQKAYGPALDDALTALPYADLSRDPLKGKCYQMAGEAQAYLASGQKVLQEKSLTYFDKAARIARKGNLEPDGSFVKTDLTSISIERAKALTLFGRFDEAHDAFAIARKKLSPELTRWQVNLLIEEAKTYLAERDVTSCCLSLLEALPIVQAIQLHSREGAIRSLLERCRQRDPHNEAMKRLDKALLTTLPLLS
jgi:transcriptional regulator with XRE-family HTH domain